MFTVAGVSTRGRAVRPLAAAVGLGRARAAPVAGTGECFELLHPCGEGELAARHTHAAVDPLRERAAEKRGVEREAEREW